MNTAAMLMIAIFLGIWINLLSKKISVPPMLSFLLLGVILGPFVLNWFNLPGPTATSIKQFALAIIILRAGFYFDWEGLKKIGKRAFLLALIPASLEFITITLVTPLFFPFSHIEAALLAGILSAVSTAVVVPLMINFIEQGKSKEVPTLVLVGASGDNIFIVAFFSIILELYKTGAGSMDMTPYIEDFLYLPVSIILGVLIGFFLGKIFSSVSDHITIRRSEQVFMIISGATLLLIYEHSLFFQPLLAIVSFSSIVLYLNKTVAEQLSVRLERMWIFMQILLFVIIASQVDLALMLKFAVAGIIIISIGLVGRVIGVQLCLLKSKFSGKERIFVSLSYLPKATVQAALGAMPLLMLQSMGRDTTTGEIILSIAVLSIFYTSTLGSILLTLFGSKLLKDEKILTE